MKKIIALLAILTGLVVTGPVEAAEKPNVIVVMLDDMPAHTMWVLEDTLELMSGGTSYTNAVVEYALCCPSRATFLSAQFSHNNGVATNYGGASKFNRAGWGNNNLGTWMQDAGYNTSCVGKWLNGYKGEPLPGCDRMAVLVGSSAYNYVNYTINVDGVTEQQRMNRGGMYQTDRLAAAAVEHIGDLSATGDPFFMWVTPLAPHMDGGDRYAVPAPEYANSHNGARYRSPATNDPGRMLRPATERRSQIGAEEQAIIDYAYETILESLESVDDMMEEIYAALETAGELDNTIVMFTSDHGYYLGEHGLEQGKIVPYEGALNVPLYVSGPGFTAGVDDRLTVNVDVPATILDVAGATSPRHLDGIPLTDLFDNRAVPLTGVRSGREYQGVRTDDKVWWTYQQGRLEAESYDLAADPWQNNNLTTGTGKWRVPAELQTLTNQLAECAGPTCIRSHP